ncbi:DsrE family protein [Allopontixanthobacter sp.]|uniref:DsrE family protein n=1 Tax=Allopontixanthobacter sp. TaxID=2906452 RepID=UPI002AB9B5B6|nr:DsrE family protein [Allopontixanthobacter sp.]MDZ4307213.1 DsrE family protein [Allopontixanthobacter sp.]
MSKTAIIIYSDPKSGTEEALGRLFNALFLAFELKEKGQETAIVFQGAGTRWPAELVKPEHPAHTLYEAVKSEIAGVCGGCADVFGATEDARKTGLKLDYEKAIPGTPGILDISTYLDHGYSLVTF